MYSPARLDEEVSTALGIKILVKCLERSKQAGQACSPMAHYRPPEETQNSENRSGSKIQYR